MKLATKRIGRLLARGVMASTIILAATGTVVTAVAGSASSCTLIEALAEPQSNTLVMSGSFNTCKDVSVWLPGALMTKRGPKDLPLQLLRKGNASLLADLAGVTLETEVEQLVWVKCGLKVKCQKDVTYPDEPQQGPPAPVAATGQTTSYAAGDDGNLEKGVEWPDPRFTDNGDGTVTDNLTGLIWLRNTNCFGSQSWDNALAAANTLNSGECGLSDTSAEGVWRMPNNNELHSLIDFGRSFPALPSGHPFTGLQTNYYWSSTSLVGSTSMAWGLYLGSGVLNVDEKSTSYYVWPVRGGQ